MCVCVRVYRVQYIYPHVRGIWVLQVARFEEREPIAPMGNKATLETASYYMITFLLTLGVIYSSHLPAWQLSCLPPSLYLMLPDRDASSYSSFRFFLASRDYTGLTKAQCILYPERKSLYPYMAFCRFLSRSVNPHLRHTYSVFFLGIYLRCIDLGHSRSNLSNVVAFPLYIFPASPPTIIIIPHFSHTYKRTIQIFSKYNVHSLSIRKVLWKSIENIY